MIPSITFLLSIATLSLASPIVEVRAVTELNKEATEEAHQRDNGATRAFSAVEIKTSDGQCLFVDELSGDFRANLTPIQVAACDGSTGQAWDIITKGEHNNKEGTMLVVNTLTQACMDVNKGRAGREVTAFSCGGRAAGEGVVTDAQLWKVATTGTFSFTNIQEENGCLALVGNALAQAACDEGAAAQTFTIGDAAAPEAPASPVASSTAVDPINTSTSAEVEPITTSIQAPVETPASSICIITTMVTVIGSATQTGQAAPLTPTGAASDLAIPTYKY